MDVRSGGPAVGGGDRVRRLAGFVLVTLALLVPATAGGQEPDQASTTTVVSPAAPGTERQAGTETPTTVETGQAPAVGRANSIGSSGGTVTAALAGGTDGAEVPYDPDEPLRATMTAGDADDDSTTAPGSASAPREAESPPAASSGGGASPKWRLRPRPSRRPTERSPADPDRRSPRV